MTHPEIVCDEKNEIYYVVNSPVGETEDILFTCESEKEAIEFLNFITLGGK